MRRIALISWLVILSATAGGAVWATEKMAARPGSASVPLAHVASAKPLEELSLATGKIVAIDPEAGRVTVSHRGLGRLLLEPGTTKFRIEDQTLLTGLSPGDKIRFDVEREGKHFAITRIENSN